MNIKLLIETCIQSNITNILESIHKLVTDTLQSSHSSIFGRLLQIGLILLVAYLADSNSNDMEMMLV